MIDTKTYRVERLFTNDRGYLSIRNMISLMLEVSFDQAARIEANLAMAGLVWMLYSWDLEILYPLMAGDDIEISTIPIHMQRFFAYREFFIKKDGQICARALGKFILFDKVKARAAIICEEIEKAYGKENPSLEESKIIRAKDFDSITNIQIRQADKDINGHVNNAVYFDYLKEIDGFADEKISKIKLVYKNEIRYERQMKLSYKTSNKECVFSLDQDSKNHSYGRIIYV